MIWTITGKAFPRPVEGTWFEWSHLLNNCISLSTYHLVLGYVTEGEVVCKVVFPDHHDQHFEKACPRVVKHFIVLDQQDEEDHAKSDEGRYVNHEELDQLVDHLVMH